MFLLYLVMGASWLGVRSSLTLCEIYSHRRRLAQCLTEITWIVEAAWPPTPSHFSITIFFFDRYYLRGRSRIQIRVFSSPSSPFSPSSRPGPCELSLRPGPRRLLLDRISARPWRGALLCASIQVRRDCNSERCWYTLSS